MAALSPAFVIAGLSRSEQADLLERLPDGSAEVHQAGLAGGELGDTATAIVVITLTIAVLTGICGWLSSKGKNVKLSLQVEAPGNLKGSFGLEITGTDTPADVQARLAKQGVTVPTD